MQQVIDGLQNTDMRMKYDGMIRKISEIKNWNGYMKWIGSQVKGTTFVSDRLMSLWVVGFWTENEDYILVGFDTDKCEYHEKGVPAAMDCMCWILSKVNDNKTKVTYYVKTDPNVKMIPTSVLKKLTKDSAILPLYFAEYLESGKS